MTAPGPKGPFTWQDYEHGRNSPRQGSPASLSSRVHFDESESAAESARVDTGRINNEDHETSSGPLRRRRSSLSMRINSLAQVGGLNSLENFARSWQRAAGFNEIPSRRPAVAVSAEGEEEGIGARWSEPSPTERRSLLRQQLERHGSGSDAVLDDTSSTTADMQRQALAKVSDARRSDVVDRAPYLASPYASSNGGIYGSLTSRVNESSLQHAGKLFDEQQRAGVGEPDREDEPLLIRRIEQEDGKIIEEVIGRSTLPQTVLNSVNVLVGVGILSLPLALRYSGWLIGALFLSSSALATRYTAGLLAKCLNQFPRMTHFSELGSAAFGIKTRVAMEILITLELAAACVALVVLFADSLNALIPGWGWLMFGTSVRDEITSNILLTQGYSRAISIIIVVFIAIIPITKIPLK
ncbi:MAG: hypothetical protein Q9196_004737 [Gyalolechia fulgens]